MQFEPTLVAPLHLKVKAWPIRRHAGRGIEEDGEAIVGRAPLPLAGRACPLTEGWIPKRRTVRSYSPEHETA